MPSVIVPTSEFLLELLDLCPSVLEWSPLVGRDRYGAPTYGDPTYYPCQNASKLSRSAAFSRTVKGEGAEILAESTIIVLAVLDSLTYEDQVSVDGGKAYLIANWQIYSDETGPLYTEITLGSANG